MEGYTYPSYRITRTVRAESVNVDCRTLWSHVMHMDALCTFLCFTILQYSNLAMLFLYWGWAS